MPREFMIDVPADNPVVKSITARRAETLRVTVTPSISLIALTISPTAGGAPIVEIPGADGLVVIRPELVSVLVEGKIYQMNIWNVTDESDPLLLVSGLFKPENTIQPGFVEYASQYLSSGTNIIHLSQFEYDQISDFPDDTIYIITEPVA